MKRFWILSAFLLFTVVVMGLTTRMSGSTSVTHALGMPVVGWGTDAPCWVAFGGKGVIVLGIGAGLVEYGVVGAGLLFACGQASLGLIAFGQAAVGLVFVCAQLGFGLTGLGQLMIGGWGIGQAPVAADGKAFLSLLNADLDDLLGFFPKRKLSDPTP